MTPQPRNTRQWLIVILLLACIGACALLLVRPDLFKSESISGLEELDQIIQEELDGFNIRSSQIRISETGPDGGFKRKVFRIQVASGLSKTFLHAELAHRLHPLGVRTPALVGIPDDELKIHIYWLDTIVRTIILYTDSQLVRHLNPGSALFFFDSRPAPDVLQTISQLGEPVRILLRSDNADVLLAWVQDWPRDLAPPVFWLDYDAGIAGLSEERFNRYISDVNRLRKQWPSLILYLTEDGGTISDNRISRLRRTGATLTRPKQALAIASATDRNAFSDQLQRFADQAAAGGYPVIVIPALRNTIDWFREDLANHKKSGLTINPPQFIR